MAMQKWAIEHQKDKMHSTTGSRFMEAKQVCVCMCTHVFCGSALCELVRCMLCVYMYP
jgi:hypothetical protein